MPTVQLNLPRPHEAQQRIKDEARRFNVVDCGRRWGKTTLGQDVLIQPAFAGHPVAWFAPTYRMLSEVWREVKRLLAPIARTINEQEHRIELVNGGSLDFWSLDAGVTTRGRKYKRAVLDEAALDANLLEHWQADIRPTLTDLKGDAWFLSTPRGLGGFNILYQQGISEDFPDWISWKMPTASNPFIDAEEIAAARQDLPERIFAQEYLAEFVSEGYGVFRHVKDAATATPERGRHDGHRYVVGCDWGKQNDFTVYSVLDVTTRAQVHLERSNQVDYYLQVGRLRVICETFKPELVIAERNAMGEPIIEQAVRMGIPIWPFTTTHQSKNLVVESLALAFERRQLKIIDHPLQIAELEQFTTERLPSGLLRYTAPEGLHDDYVLALAMAWLGACQPSGRIVQRDFKVTA